MSSNSQTSLFSAILFDFENHSEWGKLVFRSWLVIWVKEGEALELEKGPDLFIDCINPTGIAI
jgi:hypothetical protein